MLIDSHCHLDFPEFKDDLPGVLKRAHEAGVKRIISISTHISRFESLLFLVKTDPRLFCTIGIHPHHTAEKDEVIDEKKFLSYCKDEKVVAIGEIGLDYHYDYSPRDVQQRIFRQQLELAIAADLPVAIHTREAEEDTYQILKEYIPMGLKGLLHCFTSQAWLAEKMIELGFYVSFSGIITFKKTDELRAVLKSVPLDRLIIETDAPFLAPVPMRGKPNEPSYMRHTFEFIAEFLEQDPASLEKILQENTMRLFNKMS